MDSLADFDLYRDRPQDRAAGHAGADAKRAQLQASGHWDPLDESGAPATPTPGL